MQQIILFNTLTYLHEYVTLYIYDRIWKHCEKPKFS